jgi:hypothetical protein
MRRSLNRQLGFFALVLYLGFPFAARAQATAAAPAQAAPAPATPAPATPAAPAPEWKSYSYSANGFSASFPSEPEMQKRDIPTDAGSFQLRSYIAQVGPVALFVGVCDYGAAAEGKDPDEMLQGAKGGALKNSNSNLVSEHKITLGIYHGVAFESESDTSHFSARIYVVGTTLYQTLVVAPKDAPYSDTTRFLDSFQLIARVRS